MSVFEAIKSVSEAAHEIAEETHRPIEAATDLQEQQTLSKMELHDVPNCANAITHGNPFELSKHMDFQQGDTELRIRGNCGIVSSRNLIAMNGVNIGERELTKYAVESGLCESSKRLPASDRGGTNSSERQKLLETFGVKTETWLATDASTTVDRIADALDRGRGGILSLNAGALYDDPRISAVNAEGRPMSNHVVTLLGAVRDGATSEVKGFFICDSGTGEACKYVDVDRLEKAFCNVENACVQMSKERMRGIEG